VLEPFENFVWQGIASQCAEQPPLLRADFAFSLIIGAEKAIKTYGNYGTERALRYTRPEKLDPKVRNALAAKDFALDEFKQSEAELDEEIQVWNH